MFCNPPRRVIKMLFLKIPEGYSYIIYNTNRKEFFRRLTVLGGVYVTDSASAGDSAALGGVAAFSGSGSCSLLGPL